MNLKVNARRKNRTKISRNYISFNKRLKFFNLDTLNIACDRFYNLPFSYGTFQRFSIKKMLQRLENIHF